MKSDGLNLAYFDIPGDRVSLFEKLVCNRYGKYFWYKKSGSDEWIKESKLAILGTSNSFSSACEIASKNFGVDIDVCENEGDENNKGSRTVSVKDNTDKQPTGLIQGSSNCFQLSDHHRLLYLLLDADSYSQNGLPFTFFKSLKFNDGSEFRGETRFDGYLFPVFTLICLACSKFGLGVRINKTSGRYSITVSRSNDLIYSCTALPRCDIIEEIQAILVKVISSHVCSNYGDVS
tara:strand:+ start:715 stop:1416 length:702 start_codon:yes stop_codon:yes gene_type:complete